MPTLSVLVERYRLDRFAEILIDRALPELHRFLISIYNTHFPFPGKLFPNLVRRLHPDSKPARAAYDKEFCHIPNIVVAGNLGASSHERKASQVTARLDEKRITIRLLPI